MRALVLVFCWLVADAASAHPFEHPKTMQLSVQKDRILIAMGYDVDPGDSARLLRSLFDRDADGRLGPPEHELLARYLERTALMFLFVHVDGQPVPLLRREAHAFRIGADVSNTASMGIQLVYEIALPTGGTRFRARIEDRDKDARKHVPTIVDLGANWLVQFASQGELSLSEKQIRNVRLGPETPLVFELRPGRALAAAGGK